MGEQMVRRAHRKRDRQMREERGEGRSSGEKKDKGTRSRSSDDEKRFVNSNTRPCRLPKRPVTFRATISA